MTDPAFFVTGGTLRQDAQSYVARAADAEVLDALRAGDFCYVLTSRQMGKSSLMVRAAAQLRAERLAVVVLDLTGIGQNLDVEQWYFSMLTRVGEQVHLEDELEAHWDARQQEAPLQRFMGAIREVYLGHGRRRPLVIFVDEIDYVRSLQKFSADEFFAGIRECYNRRTQDEKLRRLTFCLLGVATPSDLIRDQRMTPFNIGRGIELHDFTPVEAQVLADGLSPHRETAHLLLERILSWTSGHPYLTQKLCAEVVKAGAHDVAAVDRVCEEIYLSAQARERDDNLHFVRERVLHSAIDRAALLDTYAKVRRGERVADDHLNPVINELRLSGIVRVVDGFLRVRNQIYAHVFDRKWARDNLPDAERRRQRDAFRRGVRRVASLAIVLISLVTALAVYAFRQGQKADTARREAIAQKQRAIAQTLRAEEKQKEAITEKKRAEEKEKIAIAQTKVAEDEKHKADLQREQTARTLSSLVETQARIEGLLEGIAPLLGDKSDTTVLKLAENVVAAISAQTSTDPRIRLGQAGLHRVFAKLYLQLANIEAAREQAIEARKLLQLQCAEAPKDAGLFRTLHAYHLLVGECYLGGGGQSPPDREQALIAYREALAVAEKLLEANPADAEARRLVFATLLTIADAEIYPAEDFGALRYSAATKWIDAQSQSAPDNADLKNFRAEVHEKTGVRLFAVEKLKEAQHEFLQSLEIRQASLDEGGSGDPDRKNALAVSYNKIGNVYYASNRWSEALEYHSKALQLREEICALPDPKLEWQRHLGFSRYNVAQDLHRSRRDREAVAQHRKRFELAEQLLRSHRGDPDVRKDFDNAIYGFVNLLLSTDPPLPAYLDEGLKLAEQAVKMTKESDPRSLRLLAQAYRVNNRAGDAKKCLEDASRLLPAEDKRSSAELALAQEIELELKKIRAGGAGGGEVRAASNPRPGKRKRR